MNKYRSQLISKKNNYYDARYYCPKCNKQFRLDIQESIEVNVGSKFYPFYSPIDVLPSSHILCSNCGTNLVNIDDKILETILILNEKQYFTAACCAGHNGEDDALFAYSGPYISFKPGIELPILEDGSVFIPKDFDIEKDPFIYFNISPTGSIDALVLEQIIIRAKWDVENAIGKLYNWVKDLRVNDVKLDSNHEYNPGEEYMYETACNEGYVMKTSEEEKGEEE